MDNPVFFKWLKINVLFFVGSFLVTSLAVVVSPDTLLGFGRMWGRYTIDRAPTISDPATRTGLFMNIVVMNIRSVVICFFASLLFVGPLLSVLLGVFYAIGFMSALERGLPVWHSPLLIAVEASFLLLAVTMGSVLATELFGIPPERKEIIRYFKETWKKLIPEVKKDWKTVLRENKNGIILGLVLILVLILLGAWVEVCVITV